MTAPIVVFAYKRPIHLQRTLDALARNELAAKSDLFIFCDGPKAEKDAEAVEEARGVAKAAKGFRRIKLVMRDKNMGLAHSVITGVSEIISEHSRVIVVEDDIETSPKFLIYMNRALEHYAKDPNAFSVTGFNYVARYLPIPTDYPYDVYSSYRISSWSWGTWADRWLKVRWDMDYFPELEKDRSAQSLFNRGGADLFHMLQLQRDGHVDSWAIRFAYAQHMLNLNAIYPVKALARNIGLDSSGTHTGEDPKSEHDALDAKWLPKKFCPASVHDSRIDRAFYGLFNQPPIERPKLFKRLLDALRT